METGEQLQALRQTKLIHGLHIPANETKNDFGPEPLPNDTGAKSAETIGIGKVNVTLHGKLSALPFGKKAGGQGRSLRVGQLRRVGPNRAQDSVEAPDRLSVSPEVNIRGAVLLTNREIII